ncbi:hypothetical protein PAPHI01_2730, partial [Pancytospora philotis]
MSPAFTHTKVKGKRRLHDAWALILWVVLLAAVNTYTLVNFPAMSFGGAKTGELKMSGWDLVVGCISNSMLFSSATLLLFVALTFCPRACIITGLFGACLAPLLLCLIDPMVGIVACLVPLLVTVLVYFFLIRKHMSFIVRVLSVVAVILSNYTPQLIGLYIALQCACLAQSFLLCVFYSLVETYELFYVLAVLPLYWVSAVCDYFFQVLSAGIVINHISQQQSGGAVFGRSLINTLYAMGTICFGGLLLALVNTLRFIAAKHKESNERNRNRHGGGDGILGVLLYAIAMFLLEILGAIIEAMNNMVFPYVAVYGTS